MKREQKLPWRDAWVIWFILGMFMINYPLLSIFNKNVLIFGIPLLPLYLFLGWPISIFVIYLFSVYLCQYSDQRTNKDSQSGEST